MKFKPLAVAVLVATACSGAASHAAEATAAVTPKSSPTAPQSPADAKERSRLEELFIWRASEELRLAPGEEAKFTEAIHAINKRRRDANARMDDALKTLASAKTRAEAEKALTVHRAALREMQAAANSELDKLKPLLGAQKLAQYLVVKNSILEKLKEMLASPSQVQASTAKGVSAGAAVPSAETANAANPGANANATSTSTSPSNSTAAPQAATAKPAKLPTPSAASAAATAAAAAAAGGPASAAAQTHGHALGTTSGTSAPAVK